MSLLGVKAQTGNRSGYLARRNDESGVSAELLARFRVRAAPARRPFLFFRRYPRPAR